MSRLGQTQVPNVPFEQHCRPWPCLLDGPMHTPCRQCHRHGPGPCTQKGRVLRSFGVGCAPQVFWACGAIGEQVGDPHRAKAKRARPALAAFDRRIICLLGRGRRIQHDVENLRSARLPDPAQSIAISAAGRIPRRAPLAIPVRVPFDHGATLPCGGKRCKGD